MIKKVLHISLWVLLSAGILFLLGFVESKQNDRFCSGLDIYIDRSNGNFFVDEDDIYAMVYHEADTVVGKKLVDINSEALEHKINNHPSVEKSEVYKTIEGKLVVEVEQRTPIVRIFAYNGDSYYIDSTGRIMPPSAQYTARVMVANGYIFDNFIEINHLNARELSDSLEVKTLVDDIFELAEYIRKDELWSAQIEQLYVNKDFELELIPRVGNHRIVIGDATAIDEKFDKLKIFYYKGLSKTGWNEYSVINLKYANQVVCTKRM
ncbi:MAG: cell division protein FtsQ [Flavobacteriales bacterium]|nr:cell division protein FtsQ [Flavobacteriales bacterium]|tara:strand:+ start:85343 stop:86137 length:795 start_codon:yes stop_codon:yes gene_type:complete